MTRLQISINGETKEYHIPVKWDEVSIKQYQELMVVAENEDLSDIEIMVRSVAALTGAEVEHLTKAPIKHLRDVYSTLSILTSEMPNNELRRVIEIEGIEYGFIPDMNDLTFGEFVDLDTWLQDGYKNLVDILVVLYRPVVKRKGERYIIEEYDTSTTIDRASIFSKSMSIDSVYGAIVFFCDTGSKLIETTQCYLEMQRKKTNYMEQTEQSRSQAIH